MSIPAFPLAWPAGWKRTSTGSRASARFSTTARGGGSQRLTISEAVLRVREVLDRMGIRDDDLVISSNLELRLDGFPRSNQSEPADQGGAAILDRAFTGFAALDPPEAHWSAVLGVTARTPIGEVRATYRRLRSQHHPDNGGNAATFDAVQKAYTAYCRDNGIEE